jgi:quercetin dioxygenase-like cupin family protein
MPRKASRTEEIGIMISRVNRDQLRRGLCVATILAGATLIAAPARAGQCPADKTQAGARTTGETKPKDVTDNVLGMIELGKEKIALADRRLRLRKLVVQPGGVVPWHSHEDRPALIYIVSGSIHEYASNCSVAIEHKAGEVSVEKLGVQHWWKNNSKGAVVLLSADLFHDDKHEDEHTM